MQIHARPKSLDRVHLRRNRALGRVTGVVTPEQSRQDARELARQALVAMHKIPKALREDENPLAIRNLGQKLLSRFGASKRRALSVAGRAGHASLAGIWDQQAVAAFVAAMANDPEPVHSAAKEGAQGILGAGFGSTIRSAHHSAFIVRVGRLRAAAKRYDPAFDLIADEPVERTCARTARLVGPDLTGRCFHTEYTIEGPKKFHPRRGIKRDGTF